MSGVFDVPLTFCARDLPQCGPSRLTLAEKQFRPQLTNTQPCSGRNDPLLAPPLPSPPGAAPHGPRTARGPPQLHAVASSVAAPRSVWIARGRWHGGLPVPTPVQPCTPLPPKRWALNDRRLGARCGFQEQPEKCKDAGRPPPCPAGPPPAHSLFCPALLNPLFLPRVDDHFARFSGGATLLRM